MEDRLAKILNSLSERINKWESESEKCIELEANFKSMESASKLAYMQAGESAVKAEAMLRATPSACSTCSQSFNFCHAGILQVVNRR